MTDLSKLSAEELKNLRTEISSELARRSGEGIDIKINACPKGGVIFHDRPAIGGDRNEDIWFPTLAEANAYLLLCAGDYTVTPRGDGTLYCDYTRRGCSQSDMWTSINK
jgi:hypothetical protein